LERRIASMNEFKVHDAQSASCGARETLEQVRKKYGFVPNLHGVLAESPTALEAYVSVSGTLEKSSLSPVERQVVLLSVSFENRCHYCVAAHSAVAKMAGADDEVLGALRNGGTLADSRLEALRNFTRKVVEKRGWVSDEETDAFFKAGFTKAQLLEVITGVALKTLSNYTNHIAHTPLDEPFQPLSWSAPEEKVNA
jgi:uncharacterized peroxidase-related enzyme